MENQIPTEEDFNEINNIVKNIEEENELSNTQVIDLEELIQEVDHLDDLNLIIED
jgi:hypothetical protein